MKFKTIKPPYQLQPLKLNGLTNDLFLINQQFFLKQSKEIAQPFLDFNNQVNVIKAIQWKSFTLPITEVTISNNKILTLMPYYHKLVTLGEEPIYEKLLTEISFLIKALHKISFNKQLAIKSWNGLQQLNLYCNLTTTNENLVTITNDIKQWISNYQPTTIVLSHNDLTINNFVKVNHCWYLIDWDFACWNDELFDIASFASESLSNDNDINFWFSCFNLTKQQIIITKKWITYQNLIWYYWACYLYEKTKLTIYQEISNHKLANLLRDAK